MHPDERADQRFGMLHRILIRFGLVSEWSEWATPQAQLPRLPPPFAVIICKRFDHDLLLHGAVPSTAALQTDQSYNEP